MEQIVGRIERHDHAGREIPIEVSFSSAMDDCRRRPELRFPVYDPIEEPALFIRTREAHLHREEVALRTEEFARMYSRMCIIVMLLAGDLNGSAISRCVDELEMVLMRLDFHEAWLVNHYIFHVGSVKLKMMRRVDSSSTSSNSSEEICNADDPDFGAMDPAHLRACINMCCDITQRTISDLEDAHLITPLGYTGGIDGVRERLDILLNSDDDDDDDEFFNKVHIRFLFDNMFFLDAQRIKLGVQLGSALPRSIATGRYPI
jgi:hypothetical protein